MAKEELIEMQGSVTEVLPDLRFRDPGQRAPVDRPTPAARCASTISGIPAGDKVSLEMSPLRPDQGPYHLPPPGRIAALAGHGALPARRDGDKIAPFACEPMVWQVRMPAVGA